MTYASLMPAFIEHPKEAAIIGRMLAGYGELEFLLAFCMQDPMGSLSKATRLLFRNRGEQQRILIADAILHPLYEECGLQDVWLKARGAINTCRTFRNQYSHCHWRDEKDLGLFFTNLEKGAKTAPGMIALEFFHVDVPLLAKQEAFFRYAGNHLMYLEVEQRVRAGKLRTNPFAVPERLEVPARYNPPDQHPIIAMRGGLHIS
jgi:hypothetical protein